ncbi:hypothetical protein JXB11_03570, partial [Candidatus Woesearchaeota archaeon]|nr:hypothetical protein [Candidatus Woesearchaeota archaeon]
SMHIPLFSGGYDLFEKEFDIGGRKVIAEIEFEKYPPGKYRKDFLELVKEQSKKRIDRALQIRKQSFIAAAKMPPYSEFKKITEGIFIKTLQQVLSANPSLIIEQEENEKKVPFEIRFSIEMSDDQYFLYDWKTSELHHVYAMFNGFWILQTIVLPYIAMTKKEYEAARSHRWWTRNLKFHENQAREYIITTFVTHRDYMNKKYRDEDEARARFWQLSKRSKVMRRENYAMFFLYLTFEELRYLGLPMFAGVVHRPKIEFRPKKIAEFREKLKALIKMRTIDEAKAYFDDEVSVVNPNGTEYIGLIMTFTIALAVAKEEGVLKNISAGNGRKALRADYIATIMSQSDRFWVSNLPEQVYKKTFEIVSGKKYREFIDLYEWACDQLKIKMGHRAVTRALFDELKKESTGFYKRHERKEISRRKYAPPEYS